MSRKKIGRNEPCWCESGKKFKHCHLDRENQEPIQRWEVSNIFRQAYTAKTCLAPEALLGECNGKIVHAHTVPKSGSLQRISRAGHVYSFVPSLNDIQKNQGFLVPKLLGINNASTFSGFCSRHDNEIFTLLEKQAFRGTSEQCFLLGYRALARELYTKRAANHLHSNSSIRNIDRGKSIEEQIEIQRELQLLKTGSEAGLKDLNHYKFISDKMLEKREFDNTRAYIIELENPPPVMGS